MYKVYVRHEYCGLIVLNPSLRPGSPKVRVKLGAVAWLSDTTNIEMGFEAWLSETTYIEPGIAAWL